MGNFQPLSVFPDTSGVALTRRIFPTLYHLNRFRICVAPPGPEVQRYQGIAAGLLDHMPKYMNPHTAAVEVRPLQWSGHKTLRFRGVARVRPFSVPIYNPLEGRWIDVPFPEKLRDWAIPDIHTDWVGVQPDTLTATGFTAQTLKREFLDGSDALIKAAALAALAAVETKTWWNVPLALTELAAEEVLSAYVIWVNQHHFLAGRRSFRFVEGTALGYSDGRWVFETAAMERFSLLPYRMSQLIMGHAEDIVRPVWVEMVQRFCKANALRVINDTGRRSGWSAPIGPVSLQQIPFAGYPAMVASDSGQEIIKLHRGINI